MSTQEKKFAAAAPTLEGTRDLPWYKEIDRGAWWALALAGLGWLLEVYDIFVLALTLPALIAVFSLTKTDAGLLGSVEAAGLIIGGIFFGWVVDHVGRVRSLVAAIAIYSVFTGLTAISPSAMWVGAFRFLAGLGMGGEWTAGAALVAETWGAKHRGKGGALMQMGLPLGSLLAIGVVTLLAGGSGGLAAGAWRWVYVTGILPIFILLPVALKTPESNIWLSRGKEGKPRGNVLDLLEGKNFRGLARAFGFIFFIQYIYWAVFVWTPTYLILAKHFTFIHSMEFTLAQQVGSLVGFIAFAYLVDAIGRRPTFTIYLAIGAAAVGAFVSVNAQTALLVASFFTGVGITGLFAGAGPYAAEMVPETSARGFAMGIAYNGGRIGGLIAPFVVGALAASEAGFGAGLLTTIVAFVLAWVVILISPETKGTRLS